jgi:hypothetical protein
MGIVCGSFLNSIRVGPHPYALSLGGAASPRFPSGASLGRRKSKRAISLAGDGPLTFDFDSSRLVGYITRCTSAQGCRRQ